jgi:hypothetical protein
VKRSYDQAKPAVPPQVAKKVSGSHISKEGDNGANQIMAKGSAVPTSSPPAVGMAPYQGRNPFQDVVAAGKPPLAMVQAIPREQVAVPPPPPPVSALSRASPLSKLQCRVQQAPSVVAEAGRLDCREDKPDNTKSRQDNSSNSNSEHSQAAPSSQVAKPTPSDRNKAVDVAVNKASAVLEIIRKEKEKYERKSSLSPSYPPSQPVAAKPVAAYRKAVIADSWLMNLQQQMGNLKVQVQQMQAAKSPISPSPYLASPSVGASEGSVVSVHNRQDRQSYPIAKKNQRPTGHIASPSTPSYDVVNKSNNPGARAVGKQPMKAAPVSVKSKVATPIHDKPKLSKRLSDPTLPSSKLIKHHGAKGTVVLSVESHINHNIMLL